MAVAGGQPEWIEVKKYQKTKLVFNKYENRIWKGEQEKKFEMNVPNMLWKFRILLLLLAKFFF